jgi:hypothetical protein
MNPNSTPPEGLGARESASEATGVPGVVGDEKEAQTGAEDFLHGSALSPGLDSIYRCTCCCSEATHTRPDGHCTEPACTTEPCTPRHEWRATV